MSDEHGTTRRGFLTTTAVGGAALAFGCNTLPSDFAVIEGPRQLPPPFIGTGRPDDAQVERERGWTPGPVIRAWRDPGRGLAIRLDALTRSLQVEDPLGRGGRFPISHLSAGRAPDLIRQLFGETTLSEVRAAARSL